MAKVGRSYKGLESHDSKPFLLAEVVKEDVSMKLSILTKVMTLLTCTRDSWEYRKSRNGLFSAENKRWAMRDSNPLRPVFRIVGIQPFSQCFQGFPHGLQFTTIHSKSLQLPEGCGQNVGKNQRYMCCLTYASTSAFSSGVPMVRSQTALFLRCTLPLRRHLMSPAASSFLAILPMRL